MLSNCNNTVGCTQQSTGSWADTSYIYLFPLRTVPALCRPSSTHGTSPTCTQTGVFRTQVPPGFIRTTPYVGVRQNNKSYERKHMNCGHLWNGVIFPLRNARHPPTTKQCRKMITTAGWCRSSHKELNCHINLSLGRPPSSQWRRRPGRPRSRWVDQLRKDNHLQTSGGVLSTVVTVGRRYGPWHRLSNNNNNKYGVETLLVELAANVHCASPSLTCTCRGRTCKDEAYSWSWRGCGKTFAAFPLLRSWGHKVCSLWHK